MASDPGSTVVASDPLMGRVLDRLTTTAQGLIAYSSIHLPDYAATGALPPDSEDLVNLTLIAAYIKADRPEVASALIERRAHLPRLLDVPVGYQ